MKKNKSYKVKIYCYGEMQHSKTYDDLTVALSDSLIPGGYYGISIECLNGKKIGITVEKGNTFIIMIWVGKWKWIETVHSEKRLITLVKQLSA